MPPSPPAGPNDDGAQQILARARCRTVYNFMRRLLDDESKAVALTRIVHGRMPGALAEKSEHSESAVLLLLARDVLFDNLTSEQWDRTLFKRGAFALGRPSETLAPRDAIPEPDDLNRIVGEDLEALEGERRLLLELLFVERASMEETATLFNLGEETLQSFVQALLPRWCSPGDPDGFRQVKRRLSQDERASAHLDLEQMIGREAPGSEAPPRVRALAPSAPSGGDRRGPLLGMALAAAVFALGAVALRHLGERPPPVETRRGLAEDERARRPQIATPLDGGPSLVEGEVFSSDAVTPLAYRHETGASLLLGPGSRSRIGAEGLFVDRGRGAVTLDEGGLVLSTPYFLATVTSGRYLVGMEKEMAVLAVYRGEASLRPKGQEGDHAIGPMRKALVDAAGNVTVVDLGEKTDPMFAIRLVEPRHPAAKHGAGESLLARAKGRRDLRTKAGMKKAAGPVDSIEDRRPTALHRKRMYGEPIYRLSF